MTCGWVLIIAGGIIGVISIFAGLWRTLLCCILAIFIGVFIVEDLPKLIGMNNGIHEVHTLP